MAVPIPNLPRGTNTRISLLSSAVELKPYLGGNTQRIARLGDSWSYEVTCQPMHLVQAGALTAALVQGLSEKVTCRVFQDGFPYENSREGREEVLKAFTALGEALTRYMRLFYINARQEPDPQFLAVHLAQLFDQEFKATNTKSHAELLKRPQAEQEQSAYALCAGIMAYHTHHRGERP